MTDIQKISVFMKNLLFKLLITLCSIFEISTGLDDIEN